MSLVLAPPVAAWVGVLALAGGAAAVGIGARRLAALGIGRVARVLVALRVAAVLSLLLLFANPTVVSAVPPGARPRVRLLLDSSQSMRTPDGFRGGTRLDDVSWVAREATRTLSPTFSVEMLAFGAKAVPLAGPEGLDGKAAATDLAGALAAGAGSGADAPAALVLVSDGIDTAGGALPTLPCPVFAVPIGTDLARLDDARVVALRVPERVDLHTQAPVEVDVAVTGTGAFPSKATVVPVTLRLGATDVESKTLALDERGRGTARFEVRLDEAGFHALEARVGPVAGDRARSDDVRRAFTLAEDPSLRVLLLAARVTQEYRPLRAEIARAPGVRFAAVVRVAPGKAMTEGLPAGDPLATGFPSDAAALSRFDVVVLGPAPASEFAPAEEEAIARHVEGGGGLLVLGGENALGLGGFQGRPLARVLPVDVRGADESVVAGAFRAEATADGRASPLLRGLEDVLTPGDGGAGLVVATVHRTGPVKPGASALLTVRSPDGPPRPLLVAGTAGKGRVLLLLTNTLHRARAAGGGGAYEAFVRQCLRYLAARDDGREVLSLTADRPKYAPGDVARVSAVVRRPDRSPLDGATIEGRLLSLDGADRGPVTYRPTPDRGPGTFLAEVSFAGDEPMRVHAVASGGSGILAEREVLLRGAGDAREGEELAVDAARLAAIAVASGGAVVPPAAIEELAMHVAPSAPEAPRAVESSLAFDGPWLLLALAAFLTAEWVLRRRVNLP